MNVCGTFEQMLKSHWDSCASACFESSLDSCVPNSFVKLEKKKVTADGGCNSDGMAWRRYHIPITEEWVALGDLHGYDLRQADAITFAMSPIIATKFPTPVSIVAAPMQRDYSSGLPLQPATTNKTRSRCANDLILFMLYITRR